MSTSITAVPNTVAPYRPTRHALGLPAGSVRALLALSVLGLSWLITYKYSAPTTEVPVVFIYLQCLMVLILGHYFTAHGASIKDDPRDPSPLGLPTGSVRLLLLLGYGGLIYYLMKFPAQFELPQKGDFFFMLAVILSAFFIGHYLTMIVKFLSGGVLPFWFQDVQAWFAIMAMLGLAALMLIHFINPTVPPDMQIGTVTLDQLLAGAIGFYFGSR